MSQESLDFGRIYRVPDEFKNVFRATDDAKDQVGLIVAAGASGIEAPDLNKTFVPNSGRHLRMHTVMAIGSVAGLDARRAIIQPIARLFGFSVEDERPKMTDKERADRAEAACKSLGPLGEQALIAAYGGRR